MTYVGGTNDLGTIFKIKPDGNGYTKLLDFASGVNGSKPYGSLISNGTFLYGMTSTGGGIKDLGIIFKIQSDGNGYTKLLDFAGAINGSKPYGSLISDGTFLYGMTSIGGTSDLGTIFKTMPDGSGYTKLLDFAGTSNGSWPSGSLVSDGTFLYGMTSYGGTSDLGTIFKIMPDGSGYTKLLDFAGTANGSRPGESLIFDGTFLYGMTTAGGVNNDYGTIFKIMPDGNGYTKLYDFTGTSNGSNPQGSLISDGTFLYGMTRVGGTSGLGTIFKIMPDGSGYTKLLDFAGTVNGALPYSSLISDGIFLYGMTSSGGAKGDGTIFKIMPDGNGYAKLFDFDFDATKGLKPYGSLVSDGTFLYGMTSSYNGTIFKIMPDGSGFATLLDFVGTSNGRTPQGSLISDGTFLYGMTSSGGTGNAGTVFRFGCAEMTTTRSDTVCYGIQQHLSALVNSPDFYSLTWSPATGLSSTTGAVVDANLNVGITTYTVSGTNNNGCSVAKIISLDVRPLPVLTGTESLSVCFGTSPALDVTGGVTYSWNPQIYLNSATNANVTFSQAPEGSTQSYTVTGFDTLGCSSTRTLTVTTYTLPTVNIGLDQMLCSGIPASLNAIGTEGNYTWSPGTYFISNTGANVTTNVTATAGTYTCSVYLQDIHNCTTSDTVLINVTTMPTASITTSETSICSGKRLVLAAGPDTPGITYLWNNGATLPGIAVSPLTTTTYSVVVTTGPCKDTAMQNVIVTITPTLTLTSNKTIICSGDSVVLSASTSALGGGTGIYLWSNGKSSNSITVSPLVPVRYVLKLSNESCFDSDSILITVVPMPTASISSSLTVCSGNSTGLTANGGSTYLWSSGETSADINITLLINTAYSVTVSNGSAGGGGLCTDTASRSITLITPVPADTGPDITIAIGLDTVLSANNGTAWSWTPKVRLDCNTCQSTIVAPFQTTSYSVTVTDINGCLSSDSVKVYVIPCAELFVPKAFSPNNDGQNDMLYIRGTDCIEKINAFTIFNRWGEKVFESTDIKTGWDGSQTKQTLPNDVFIYYLDALSINGDAITKTGNVTLIK